MHKTKVNRGALEVVLVDRDQLRLPSDTPFLSCPEGETRKEPGSGAPAPPATLDWGADISYPMLGNDRVGDCFYVACAHVCQGWAGANAKQIEFDVRKLVARYTDISGGDNGLTWQQMLPEWRGGIIGPNGPHKALGYAGVKPTDQRAMQTALSLYGPLLLTMAIPDVWLRRHSYPGGTWDAVGGASPNQRAGHAVILTGYNDKGYLLQTWGFDPPVTLTYRGIEVCDAEAAAAVGVEWFDDQGKAPNDHDYATLRGWWNELGGSPLPETLPGTPTPPTPPTPTPPTPTDHPILDLLLTGTVAGQAIRLTGTGTPRGKKDDGGRPADLRAGLLALCPEGMGETDWAQIVELLLKLLEAWLKR